MAQTVTTAGQAVPLSEQDGPSLEKGLKKMTGSKQFKSRQSTFYCSSASWSVSLSVAVCSWSLESKGCWLVAQQGMSEHGS